MQHLQNGLQKSVHPMVFEIEKENYSCGLQFIYKVKELVLGVSHNKTIQLSFCPVTLEPGYHGNSPQ